MKQDHLQQAVLLHARKDVACLSQELTVQEALDVVRHHGLGEKIVYFYVVDAAHRLTGVLPTRRLLIAPLASRLADLMIRRVVAVPATATLLDACELFVLHKFLALPVVDDERRLLGIVDVNLFTEEVLNLAEPEREGTDDLFETIGLHLSQFRGVSLLGAFRFRFPWLLATLSSGVLCALLVSAFEATLARSLVLAFFMTLALGLGESVAAQSMTMTVHALRSTRLTWSWFAVALRREAATAVLLGASCGALAGVVVWLWRGTPMAAFSIGLSVALALVASAIIGLAVPVALHRMKLDLKIAVGPISLAIADIFTVLFYFVVASWLL